MSNRIEPRTDGTSTGSRRRPAGYQAPGQFTTVCAGCRRAPVTAAEVADLSTVWLLPGLGDVPAAARFCRACAPRGPIAEVACAACGDGPLLAGDLAAAADLATTAAIDAWLVETGWRPAGPWCPDCRGGRR